MTSFFPNSWQGVDRGHDEPGAAGKREGGEGEGEGARGVHAHHPIALPVRRVLRALGYLRGSFLY